MKQEITEKLSIYNLKLNDTINEVIHSSTIFDGATAYL